MDRMAGAAEASRPWAWMFVLVVALAAGISVVANDWNLAGHDARLPMWDMASHGLDGIRLAETIRTVDPLHAIASVWSMGLWPPFYPMVEAPVFAIWGFEYVTATRFAAFWHLAFILGIISVCVAFGRVRGTIMAGVAIGLATASPMVHFFGRLVMLELPGASLQLLAVGAYLAYQRRPTSVRATIAALAMLVLFFCKYNYGILWLVPLALIELGADSDRRRDLLKSLRAEWRSGRLRRPFPIIIGVLLLMIVIILLTGGVAGQLAGRRFSIRSPANLAYLALLVIIVWLVRDVLRSPQAARDRFRALAPLHKRLLVLFVAPVALWFLDPRHMRTLFTFLKNRSSGMNPFSPEALSFYPRDFIARYSPEPWIAWAVMILAIVGIYILWRKPQAGRVIAIVCLWGIATCFFHRYKEGRFFFTTAPFVWLACGAAVAEVLARGIERLSRRTGGLPALRSARRERASEFVAAAIAVAFITFGWIAAPATATIDQMRAGWTSPPDLRPVLDRIVAEIADQKQVCVMGMWNGLSPALIGWHLRLNKASDHLRPSGSPSRWPRIRNARDFGKAQRQLDSIIGTPEISKVIVYERLPDRSGEYAPYQKENPDIGGQIARLSADDRFALAEPSAEFPGGHRLRVFEISRP